MAEGGVCSLHKTMEPGGAEMSGLWQGHGGRGALQDIGPSLQRPCPGSWLPPLFSGLGSQGRAFKGQWHGSMEGFLEEGLLAGVGEFQVLPEAGAGLWAEVPTRRC